MTTSLLFLMGHLYQQVPIFAPHLSEPGWTSLDKHTGDMCHHKTSAEGCTFLVG